MENKVKEESVELLRYQFKADELTGLAKTIAVKLKAGGDLEQEKKSVAADYASQEKKLDLQIRDLSRQITDGYEMRRQPCLVFKDFATSMVYFFTPNQFDDYELQDFIESSETVADMVKALDDIGIYPAKRRAVRDHEKQGQLFDGEASGDEVVDVENQETLDALEAVADAEDGPPDSRGDDKDLQKMLAEVLAKKPTLKTIKQFTDAQWMECWKWAYSKFLSESMPETEVPVKPEFLGKAKG